MKPKFTPPPVERLSEVDIADCEYDPELSEIVGVVSPESQGGWPKSNEYDVHVFTLAAWRHQGGHTFEKDLTILRPVERDSEWFNDYAGGQIIQAHVLLAKDQTRAVFAELIDADAKDNVLKAIATELSEPVEIESERFGTLTLDRRIGWFTGNVIWNGRKVRISFDTDGNMDIAEQLETARALFDAEQEWQSKIEAFAVKEKLSLANDWQDERTTPITKEEFLDRMQLESISIRAEGEFEFWHDDGDLFYGHSIQISGSLKDGLTHSDIPG